MANSNLPFNYRRNTAPSSRLAAPAPRWARRHATLRHGLLVFALMLPAVARAAGPDPEQAPGGTSANQPSQTGNLIADAQFSPELLPAQHPGGAMGEGHGRRATMPARTIPFPAAPAAQRDAPSPQPDFLFGRPRMSFGLRGLWHRARAGSDFYDFVNEELFVPRSPDDDHNNPDHGHLNFDAPGISLDFGYGVNPRLDVRIGVDYAMSLNESELRNYIGSDGLPYTQVTRLSQTDFRTELAFALAPRGRAIGQYTWVPSRVVPYVGAGLSFVRHDLSQQGEFVDEIGYFEDTFTSKGWGTGVHVFGGVDIRMTRHAFINLEARHVEASPGLGDDFAGFDPLDLGGLRISAGVRFVF